MPSFIDWDKIAARLGDAAAIRRLAKRAEQERKIKILVDRLRSYAPNKARRDGTFLQGPPRAQRIIRPPSTPARFNGRPGTPGAVCATCRTSLEELAVTARFCIECGNPLE